MHHVLLRGARVAETAPARAALLTAVDAADETALAVGDSRRRTAGWALLGSLLVAAGFILFVLLTKQVRVVEAHVPWRDDPYDAVVSFSMFAVPVLAVACLLRAPACRREHVMPLSRVLDLLRAARLIAAAVSATVLAAWISVGLRIDKSAWSGLTALGIAALALLSVLTAGVLLLLRRAFVALPATGRVANSSPDWIDDIVLVAGRGAVRLGPLRDPAGRVLGWIETRLAGVMRAHAVWSAAVAALLFGAALAVSQAREDGVAPVLLLFLGVGACFMFAFLVIAGAHLRLVRSTHPAHGCARIGIHAAVAGCATVPVALAFRDALWWRTDVAGIAGMLIAAAAVVAAAVFSAESLGNAMRRS